MHRACKFALAACFLAVSVLAKPITFEHSLDGGATFKPAGLIEGNFKLRDLTLTRHALSIADAAQLSALAKADKFYTVRVAGSTTSVRASCFSAAPSDVEEKVQLVLGAGGMPTFLNYIVLSPTCRQPSSDAAPSLNPIELEVETQPASMGPVIYNLLDQTGIDSPPGGGPAGYAAPPGSPSAAGKPGGSRVGATNRPTGGPRKPAAEEAKEPQSWLSRNWMFVLGGVMIVINVMSTMGRLANQRS